MTHPLFQSHKSPLPNTTAQTDHQSNGRTTNSIQAHATATQNLKAFEPIPTQIQGELEGSSRNPKEYSKEYKNII